MGTGRIYLAFCEVVWPSRDPLDELGARMLSVGTIDNRLNSHVPRSSTGWQRDEHRATASDFQPYAFVMNQPVSRFDIYGRETSNDETHFRPPLAILAPFNPQIIGMCVGRVYFEVMPVWCQGGSMHDVTADPSCRRAHCIANCRLSRECPAGVGVALVMSWLKENFNMSTWRFDQWDPGDSPGDAKANAMGRACSYKLWESCESLCRDANRIQ